MAQIQTRYLTLGALMAAIGYISILLAFTVGTSRIFALFFASVIVCLATDTLGLRSGCLVFATISALTVIRPGFFATLTFGLVIGLYPICFYLTKRFIRNANKVVWYLLPHIVIGVIGQILFAIYGNIFLTPNTALSNIPAVILAVVGAVVLQVCLGALDFVYPISLHFWQKLIMPQFKNRG